MDARERNHTEPPSNADSPLGKPRPPKRPNGARPDLGKDKSLFRLELRVEVTLVARPRGLSAEVAREPATTP